MEKRHYVRVKFGMRKDNSPAIYDFFWKHIGSALKAAGAGDVVLDIERLEPVDMIYTNLNMSQKEAEKILHGFAKSHHLKEHAELTFEKHKTSLKAHVKAEKLSDLLKDYNVLFDLFFADLIIRSDALTVDMMDGFSNTVLAFGNEGAIHKFQRFVKDKMPSAKFEFVDPVKSRR